MFEFFEEQVEQMKLTKSHFTYKKYKSLLCRFQTETDLPDQTPITLGKKEWLIMGMGRVGTGAYDYFLQHYGSDIVGVESDLAKVTRYKSIGRSVIHGDATDMRFEWNGAYDFIDVISGSDSGFEHFVNLYKKHHQK